MPSKVCELHISPHSRKSSSRKGFCQPAKAKELERFGPVRCWTRAKVYRSILWLGRIPSRPFGGGYGQKKWCAQTHLTKGKLRLGQYPGSVRGGRKCIWTLARFRVDGSNATSGTRGWCRHCRRNGPGDNVCVRLVASSPHERSDMRITAQKKIPDVASLMRATLAHES
jgi:hypothetical protein